MRRYALAALLGATTVLAAACLETKLDLSQPLGSPTGSPTATVTPPAFDFGDGADGNVDATTDTIVNVCHRVTSASGTAVTVDTSSSYTAGRRILLLQVQDAVTATLGDTSPVTGLADAGHWELARVSSIAGQTLTVAAALTHSYGSGTTRAAEVCTLPEFDDVHIHANVRIRADPWDGTRGGVAAFLAHTMEMDGGGGPGGGVSVSGRGFRGGQLASLATGSHVPDLDLALTDGRGGGKGEGLIASAWTRAARGNLANAAGGGNADAAGGGGGGAAGSGGIGASENLNVGGGPDPITRGLGGAAITTLTTDPRLLFGAGGGAAHTSVGTEGAGGAGGGVVLIYVRTVTSASTNTSFRSAGLFGQRSTVSGGGGGGGAGGTVFVITSDGSGFSGALQAPGAHGGDSQTQDGPGGGGGGGWVYASGFSAGISTDVTGAAAGSDTVNMNSRDAAAGNDGSVNLF